jgi:hypothetical protein
MGFENGARFRPPPLTGQKASESRCRAQSGQRRILPDGDIDGAA